jgi:hypothetical protein
MYFPSLPNKKSMIAGFVAELLVILKSSYALITKLFTSLCDTVVNEMTSFPCLADTT